MQKTTIGELTPPEAEELESILRAYRQGRKGDPELKQRFYSTYDEVGIFWFVLFAGAIAGLIALTEVSGGALSFSEHLRFELTTFPPSIYTMGKVGCLLVAIWMGVKLVRNYGRRGSAATTFATIKVRGRKLAMVEHRDVAAIVHSHLGSRGKTFSVLALTDGGGKKLSLYGNGNWVAEALRQIAAARASAGLPPVEVKDEWGVHYRTVAVPVDRGAAAK